MTPEPTFGDTTLDAFARLVAARTPAPGGGATAAVVVALAAALVAMTARFSDPRRGGASSLAERADEIRRRALALADEDAAAYEAVLARAAMERAIAVPREVADLAREVAELALALVEGGNPNLAGDAATALILARAAAQAASGLVAINLEAGA